MRSSMITLDYWVKYSMFDQIGHIGSEIARIRHWENKADKVSRNKAIERAIDLIDLIKQDPKWLNRRREIGILRDVIAEKYVDGHYFDVPLEQIEQYCIDFVLLGRRRKSL